MIQKISLNAASCIHGQLSNEGRETLHTSEASIYLQITSQPQITARPISPAGALSDAHRN